MKKIILGSIFFALALVSTSSAFAQKKPNKFKGIIKVEIEKEGKKSPLTYKVYEQKILLAGPMSVIVAGKTTYTLIDFSPIFPTLKSAGHELEGSGKMYVKNTANIDSLTQNLKIVYTDETKEIAGYKAKKVTVQGEGQDGRDFSAEVWTCEEIGPEYNLIVIPFVKGFPLEYTIKNDIDEVIGKQTIVSIEKGKVKDAELLLPVGYEETTTEKVTEIIQMLQELRGQ